MNEVVQLVEETIEWLRIHYEDHPCWNEADVVSVIWDQLRRRIAEKTLRVTLRNQYEIKTSLGKKKYDLAILDDSGRVVVVEVKYEPSPDRSDIPRVLKHFKWEHLVPGYHGKDVAYTDIEKVQKCVSEGQAIAGFAILIDEASYHQQRMPSGVLPAGATWSRWGPGRSKVIDVSILVARFPLG